MMQQTVKVPGDGQYVLDEGDPAEPPILLLHAGIADLTSWDTIAPLLAAAGHRVVRHDARGFGRSVTQDVENSNRAEGGFDAEATPDETAAFVRMDAGDPEALDALIDLDIRFWVDGPGQPEDRVPATIRDQVRQVDLAHDEPTRVQGRPSPLAPSAADRLTELRCPVLAVIGALDATEVPQAARRRHLAANAPNARAVMLPDVAHMVGMVAPDRLSRLVQEFLAQGRPGS